MEDVDLRIEIDQYKLDEEWLNQPLQVLTWARELAKARLEVDQAKNSLEVTRAELDTTIRTDPQSYGLAKVTESALMNVILIQDDYAAAVDVLNKAKHRQSMVQAAVDALEHRRRALENLVSLHGMSYFADPKAPKGKEEEVKESQKKKVRSMWRERE